MIGGPTVNETEIDGVPVFWADVPGPRVGALLFRVGRGDEPAAMGGISHLVEHLALAPLSQRDHQHNGFVGDWRSVFHASGTDAELADYFDRVTRNLAELPLERLPMERRILRQEGADRDPGMVARLLWYRFGNAGHGLLAMPELGLDWLGPQPVADWARTRFGRTNAAAWFSGKPPAGLRFHLPEGDPSPDIPLDVVDGLTLPAQLAWQAPGTAVSWIAARAAESVLTVALAARRAREVLRFERGLVYDVLSDYEPLDGGVAHLYLGADCAPEHAEAVRDTLLLALDDIARQGVTEDELRYGVRQYRDSLLDPQAELGMLDGAATARILGRPREDQDAITAEYEAATPASTAAALEPALASLLLATPTPPPGRDLAVYPGWSLRTVAGNETKPAGWPLRNRGRKDRLVVGDDGVMWSDGQGRWLTVRYADCVAYRHWDGDRRELWSADGFTVRIAAEEWSGGGAIVRRVDAAVPPHLVVCGEHNPLGIEDPAP